MDIQVPLDVRADLFTGLAASLGQRENIQSLDTAVSPLSASSGDEALPASAVRSCLRNKELVAGEMARGLKVVAAFPEDQSEVSGTTAGSSLVT